MGIRILSDGVKKATIAEVGSETCVFLSCSFRILRFFLLITAIPKYMTVSLYPGNFPYLSMSVLCVYVCIVVSIYRVSCQSSWKGSGFDASLAAGTVIRTRPVLPIELHSVVWQ